MRVTLLTCILILIVAIPLVSVGQGKNPDFVLDRGDLVEDLLFQFYEESGFNGSLLVAEGDEVLYENTFGFSDFASQIPLDPETPFYLASLGKQFTAAAVLKLCEENKLNLDHQVILYFPQLPKIFTQVKIKNLLNHTSGIPDYLNSAQLQKGMTNQQVYKYISELNKLEFEPGSKYRYSNSGYVLLAMIIEIASGQAVQNYFDRELFTPLGMRNTFIYSEGTKDRRRAYGFDENEKPDYYDLFTIGDGGFYSTSADLFIWLKALNSGQIVSSSSLQEMYKPVKLTNGREKPYGFGWEIGSNRTGPLVYHTGQLAGFRTYIERQINTNTSIVILTNNSFSKTADLRNKLVKILDGRMTSISDY